MGKKIEIGFEELIERIPTLIITDEDLDYLFTNRNITKEFKRVYRGAKTEENIELIEDFLIENEKYLNKENLFLILSKNCIYHLEILKEEKEKEEKEEALTLEEKKRKYVAINEIDTRIGQMISILEEISRNGKGLDIILSFHYYDEDEKRYKVDVVDSKECIDGKHIPSSKNRKILEKIDREFRIKDSSDEDIGIEYILQFIKLSDLIHILPNKKYALDVITSIYDNKIIGKGIKNNRELDRIKRSEPETYKEIIESIISEDYSRDLRDTLVEHIKYIDIDSMLLIAACRLNYLLEVIDDDDKTVGYKEIMQIALENISSRSASFTGAIEYINEEVTYSRRDLEKFISRFINDKYISNKQLERIKMQIANAEKKLEDIDDCIDLIFSSEELEDKATESIENLKYISEKLGWTNEQTIFKVIDVYEKGLISIDKISEFKESIDLESEVTIEELDKHYKASIKEDATDEEIQEYERYANLYKEIFLKDKEEEEIEYNYNSLIDYLIDNYKGQEYVDVIENYYKQDLLTLEAIAEWNGIEMIDIMYKNGTISIDKIEKLINQGVLDNSYIGKIYEEKIWDMSLSQDERVRILLTGKCSKEVMQQLFKKTLISIKDLSVLVENNVISEIEKLEIMSDVSIEKMEQEGDYLELDDTVGKLGNRIYCNNGEGISSIDKKRRIVIDPIIREKFFESLGAIKVKPRIKESSPFYNYEFYMILGKDGKKHLNTPVIAERYYEDKETKERFANNNATYFFQYGDFLVFRNYIKKDEVVTQKKNIIFRTNHILASEDRDGKWASGVIDNIIRTILASDLKEYSKVNRGLIVLEGMKKLYTLEQIRDILTLESEIDSGKHLYEIIGNQGVKIEEER